MVPIILTYDLKSNRLMLTISFRSNLVDIGRIKMVSIFLPITIQGNASFDLKTKHHALNTFVVIMSISIFNLLEIVSVEMIFDCGVPISVEWNWIKIEKELEIWNVFVCLKAFLKHQLRPLVQKLLGKGLETSEPESHQDPVLIGPPCKANT